jgi:hypothetical protein
MTTEVQTFLDSYIETALWSSTDDNGTPLDNAKYYSLELAVETRAEMQKECAEFVARSEEYFATASILFDGRQVAHDFWLTRNRHGAGFWDGDYPEPLGQQLTDLAHSFGESNVYIGNDGKLYVA